MITLTHEEAQKILDALEYAYGNEMFVNIRATLRAKLSEPEPEPVAWFTEDHREDKSATTYSKKMSERWKEKGWPVTPLYTAPPQRDETSAKAAEWVGLTDDERDEIREQAHYEFDDISNAIEAKLKEKNG